MIFNEIYSIYYKVIRILLEKSLEKKLTYKEVTEIIKKEAFLESFIYITDNIKNENWYILNKDLKTPIKNLPNTPFSNLEMSFLKTITKDPRFKLFCNKEFPELFEYPELYSNDDFYYFDKASDSDPYTDLNYKENFKNILKGLEEKRSLRISSENKDRKRKIKEYIPLRLEYSQKDDKFRLICTDSKSNFTINVGRIIKCEILDFYDGNLVKNINPAKDVVTLRIKDSRNALERAMLHFATYEKETRELGEGTYEMKLKYNKEDRTEILIRILSFGPMILVISPEDFKEDIKKRFLRQNIINRKMAKLDK